MRIQVRYALLVLMVLAACRRPDKTGALFLIFENGKYGYINAKGYEVIPPVYFAADNFSEGLAPVRPDGTYGYIDSTGQLVIPSQYDYATPFNDGVALVYKRDTAFCIDRKGKQLFQHTFARMEPFINGKAIIETASHKMGVINKQGKLFLDTLYTDIIATQYGNLIISNYRNHDCGVIDTAGTMLVPFGKYSLIEPPTDGYYKVKIVKGDETYIGFMDTAFQLKLLTKEINYKYGISGEMHNGLAQVVVPRSASPDKYIDDESMDFIGLDGKTILNDSTADLTYPFHDNRAFVKYAGTGYGIVNTKGEKVSSLLFDRIDENETFSNGLACVTYNGKQCLIDTNAQFVIKPRFAQLKRLDTSSHYFVFKNDREDLSPAGIVDRNGHILVPPVLQRYNYYGFVNGLLSCIIQHRLAYVDQTGYITWRASAPAALYGFNTDVMTRAYYHAYSAQQKDEPLYEQGNTPRNIQASDHFPARKLSVVVATNLKDTFYQYYKGFKVFVVNHKNQPVDFNATDNILYMKVQAFTANKKWEDIEYIPRSWCGNSYHKVTLGAHQYWRFVCPAYDGAFKTKLRIELKYVATNGTDEEMTVYSNEFEGGINPGQLWREEGYTARNIMDPYLN